MTKRPLDALDTEWLLLNWSARMYMAAQNNQSDEVIHAAVEDLVSWLPEDAPEDADLAAREWVVYTMTSYQRRGKDSVAQQGALIAREVLTRHLRGQSKSA